MTISAEHRAAARAICRASGIDPDAASSSAYAAPPNWETFVQHAVAAGAVFAESFKARAEVARAGMAATKDQVEADRLKARADALREAADIVGEPRPSATVVEFRRR